MSHETHIATAKQYEQEREDIQAKLNAMLLDDALRAEMKEIAVRSSSVPIVKEPQLVEHLHDKTLHHATTDAPGSGAFRLGSDGFPVLFFRFFMGTGSIFLMLSIVFSGLGYSDLAQYCFSQLNTCVAMAVGVRLLLELIIRM